MLHTNDQRSRCRTLFVECLIFCLLRGDEEFCIFSADEHEIFRLPGSDLQFLLKLSSFQFFTRTVSTEEDTLMLASDPKNGLHKPYLETLLANAFPGILLPLYQPNSD